MPLLPCLPTRASPDANDRRLFPCKPSGQGGRSPSGWPKEVPPAESPSVATASPGLQGAASFLVSLNLSPSHGAIGCGVTRRPVLAVLSRFHPSVQDLRWWFALVLTRLPATPPYVIIKAPLISRSSPSTVHDSVDGPLLTTLEHYISAHLATAEITPQVDSPGIITTPGRAPQPFSFCPTFSPKSNDITG